MSYENNRQTNEHRGERQIQRSNKPQRTILGFAGSGIGNRIGSRSNSSCYAWELR
jgi:hypothetical protein